MGRVVIDIKLLHTKAGLDMALAKIEDQTGSCRLVIPPKAFADSAPALLPGHLVVAAGRVEGGSEREMDDVGEAGAEQVMTCIASRVFSIGDACVAHLRPKTVVHINGPAAALVLNQIQELVAQNPGPMLVVLHPQGTSITIPLPAHTRVRDDAAVIEEVRRLCGPRAWWLEDRQAPVNGRKDFSEVGAGVGIRSMKPVAGGGPTCPVR